MIDFASVLQALASEKVELIIVGGAAATAHGSARLTSDLDFAYRRTPENIGRLVKALSRFSPFPRGAPRDLPFTWDERTVKNGCNFTLTTSAGDIDALGEITGGGNYDALIGSTVSMNLFGHEFAVLDIERLISTKRAAGRPKDFEAIAELELILEEKKKPSG